jgi:hypothetical protein
MTEMEGGMNHAVKAAAWVAPLLCCCRLAHASIIFDTDPSLFLSTNPIVSTETFDEFPVTQFPGQSVTIDGVTYSDPTLFPGWTVAPSLSLPLLPLSGPNALFTQFSDANKTITFGGGDVLAFGFTFIPFGANSEFDFQVVETDGSVSSFILSPPSPYIGQVVVG